MSSSRCDLVEHGIGQGLSMSICATAARAPSEDDVLRLLHVDVGCFEDVEHVSEDARAVAVAHDELVGCGRGGARFTTSERCPSP